MGIPKTVHACLLVNVDSYFSMEVCSAIFEGVFDPFENHFIF
jgi:hypothetical protein